MSSVIEIEGVIGWEVTSRDIKQQLRNLGEVDEIEVTINSPGGYIDDGFGIYTALKNHQASVNIHITGMAASMASVIAMAGDTVTIEETGMMMIHPPSNIVWGTAVAMRKSADVLDKYESRIVKAYKRRELNLSDDDLSEAIAAETWYTAEDAIAAGFVDRVTDGNTLENDLTDTAIEWLRIAAYHNAPDRITSKLKTNNARTSAMKKKLTIDGLTAATTTESIPMSEEKVSEAEIQERITAAVTANDEKWKALLSHENSANTEAVMEIAAMNLDADKSAKMMNLVAKPQAADIEQESPNAEESKNDQGNQIAEMFAKFMAKSDLSGVNLNAGGDDEKSANVRDIKSYYREVKG